MQLKLSLPVLLFLALTSCQTISPYNEKTYSNAVNVKVDALALMDTAVDGYNEQAVAEFQIKLDKAVEYSEHLPKNTETTGIWHLIQNPDGNLLGGFLKSWKQRETVGAVFIKFKKKQIAKAFDQIIELEASKKSTGLL